MNKSISDQIEEKKSDINLAKTLYEMYNYSANDFFGKAGWECAIAFLEEELEELKERYIIEQLKELV